MENTQDAATFKSPSSFVTQRKSINYLLRFSSQQKKNVHDFSFLSHISKIMLVGKMMRMEVKKEEKKSF